MRAIYAFSGDPITYGHIDIAQRAARTYSEVVVAIGENPQKVGDYLFTSDERLALSQQCFDGLDNVTCVRFTGLLAEYAYRNDFDFIVRGVRNNSDLEGEMVQFAVNDILHDGVDTVEWDSTTTTRYGQWRPTDGTVSEWPGPAGPSPETQSPSWAESRPTWSWTTR